MTRTCKICKHPFETESPYILVCGDDCRAVSCRASRKKYKKTAAGEEATRREKKSTAHKAGVVRYMASRNAKHLASVRTQRHRKTPNGRIQAKVSDTKRRAVEGSFTAAQWLRKCADYSNRCARCKKPRPLTADHIIPVSKGGTSYIENIQPLCGSCNSSKGARLESQMRLWM